MKYSEELSVFLEVARRGSFAEAARTLNLPTTTISRKVQQLEFELNVRLFNRTTRSLSLTEVGERLVPKAIMVVEMINELKGDAQSYASNPVGTLHISAPATIIKLLSPLFSEFLCMYPNIRLQIDSSSRIKDLTTERADFAFRLGPLADSSLIATRLSRLDYSLVGSKKLIDNQPDSTQPEDLASWPCIRNRSDGLLLPWRFSSGGNIFDLETDNTVISDDLLLSVQMVLDGIGLAYLPTGLVKKYVENDELISFYEDRIPSGRDLFLVYTNKEHLPFKSQK